MPPPVNIGATNLSLKWCMKTWVLKRLLIFWPHKKLQLINWLKVTVCHVVAHRCWSSWVRVRLVRWWNAGGMAVTMWWLSKYSRTIRRMLARDRSRSPSCCNSARRTPEHSTSSGHSSVSGTEDMLASCLKCWVRICMISSRKIAFSQLHCDTLEPSLSRSDYCSCIKSILLW